MIKSEKASKREVYDERGHCYSLTGNVGEGGQGVVCATNHENVLVKICTRPKSDRQVWIEHIRWLMQQDLEGLNIARPVARITKPRLGYVMELMDGLEPLQQLMDSTELSLQDGGIDTYLQQGGIKRRLTLMANLARTLADLHGRGMAFGDLSPANIFVSEDVKYSQLWLIDCDNICVEERDSFDISEDPKGRAGRVYTPFYGAPEIVSGEALISSLTDGWSFAVIAFRLLTAIHPFIGDMVSNGEPELEDEALAGKFPWVDHPHDHLNQASVGLPRELVLLKPLTVLFERCFNDGRDDPQLRPSMAEWAECLEHCCEWLVDCQDCGSSYFYQPNDGQLACGFCEAKATPDALLFLRHYLHDKKVLEIPGANASDCYIDTGIRQVVNVGSKTTVKTSPPGSGFYQDAKPLYDLLLSETSVFVNPAKGVNLKIKVGAAKAQVFSRPFQLKLEDKQSRKVYVMPDRESVAVKDVCIFKW